MGSLDKSFLVLVSLFLALLLWLQVATTTDPATQREFTVPLKLENVGSNLLAVRYSSRVPVVAEGAVRALDRLNPDEWSANVDLKSLAAGEHRVNVQLAGPARALAKVSLKRGQELIELAQIARVQRAVEVEERGSRPSDLRYDGATVEPNLVTLVGPERDVQAVVKVRASLDLTRIRPGVSHQVAVEVLDLANRPVPNVEAEPGQVTVLPAVAAAPANSNILVSPQWTGQPAFGFEVASYEMRPSQVVLTGKSSDLAAITKVDTSPIDLTGLSRNAIMTVPLILPKGTRTVSGRSEVTVTVRVRKQRTTEAPPPTTNPVPTP